MSKTNIVLFKPDGNVYSYQDVKSYGVNDKGFLTITPKESVQSRDGHMIHTTLPFHITKTE